MSVCNLYASCSYAHDVAEVHAPSGEPLPLDPIDVAGSANLSRIRELACCMDLRFCLSALDWLEDPATLWLDPKIGGPKVLNDHRPSAKKYTEHFRQMWQDFKILEKLKGPTSLLWISSYFAVKKDEFVSRAIFSGRALSNLFRAPPPVNIPSIETIFGLLSVLVRGSGRRYYMYTSDIRHWFHQIKIGNKLARYMGFHDSDDNYYRYKVLPMGWSYSPRICQSLAWTIILAPPDYKKFADDEKLKGGPNSDGLQKARVALRQAIHPPKFVLLHDDTGARVGHVTLTYDNISISVCDKAIFEALTEKIRCAMHWCNVILKVEEKVYPEQLAVDEVLSEDFKGSSHLGIQYGIRSTAAGDTATWRLDPVRVLRYDAVLDALDDGHKLSRREIARVVGIVIWHLSVIQRPLCYATTLIAILQSLTKDQPTLSKKEWDCSVELSEGHRNYLTTMLCEVMRNDWHDATPVGNERRLCDSHILFTDSSKLCMGAVLVMPDGTSHAESIPFHKSIVEVHIFLKELTALIWFTVKYIKLLRLRNVHLHIVTDNSAAFFAMTHLYSSNRYANRWIRYFHTHITKAGVTFSIHQVISEDNPADCPSRFLHVICPKRLKAGMSAVRASVEGQMRSSVPGKIFVPDTSLPATEESNPLRHRERTSRPPLEDSDDDLDDIADIVKDVLCPVSWEAPSRKEMKQWFGIGTFEDGVSRTRSRS